MEHLAKKIRMKAETEALPNLAIEEKQFLNAHQKVQYTNASESTVEKSLQQVERMEMPVVKLSPEKDAQNITEILMSEKTSSRYLLQNCCSNQCQAFLPNQKRKKTR